MIGIFEWLGYYFNLSFDLWVNLTESIRNPDGVFWIFFVSTFVSLTYIIRWQIKNTRPWHLEGLEMVGAMFLGGAVTAFIYLLPFFVWCVVGACLLLVVLVIITVIAGLGTGR